MDRAAAAQFSGLVDWLARGGQLADLAGMADFALAADMCRFVARLCIEQLRNVVPADGCELAQLLAYESPANGAATLAPSTGTRRLRVLDGGVR
jgi:hypothetical protein